MGNPGIKICACCRKSFRPQISDDEMLSLYYTEEQLEQDREHEEMTGHSHLGAPFQDLCIKCAMDPNLERVGGGFFGGPMKYRIKDPNEKPPKKLKVKDLSRPDTVLFPSPQDNLNAMGEFLNKTEHHLIASDGTPVTMTGSDEPPPQEIVDIMASLGKSFQKGGPKSVQMEMKKLDLTNQPQKKRPWWAFWKRQ